MQSDRIFHYPASRLADLQVAHQPRTYSYLFSWRPPVIGDRIGACHAIEIPFVFGGARSRLMRTGLVVDRAARPLCDYMQEAWTAFARSGEPRPGNDQEWPAYEVRRRQTKELGPQRGVFEDPHEAARLFWEPLIQDGEVRLTEKPSEA